MNENTTTAPQNKSHYKVNEVCAMTGVRPYVLRFWESEFPEISPTNSSSGQKLYEHKDVELIAFIKDLLFNRKMNIEQAKAQVKLGGEGGLEEREYPPPVVSPYPEGVNREMLMAARKKLNALLALTTSLKERHHWP